MKHITCILIILVLSLKSFAQRVPALIPAPTSLKTESGSFAFSRLTAIKSDVRDPRAIKFLTDYLLNSWGFRAKLMGTSMQRNPNQTLLFITEKGAEHLATEGYKLSISGSEIKIIAKGAGLFYAIQTLIQLFPNQKAGTAILPCLTIEDQPRFAYRGLMLDVSRHFFSVAQIKDLLDLMAAYKLNKFHWHLTDDQGWRLEIKSRPKLTQVGAWRVPRTDFGMEVPMPGEKATDGGFYSQEQVKDIVQYAAERHIEIMPEIDVPGHSMAALAAYPELSVTQNTDTKVNPGSSFAKWFPSGGFEMYVDNTLNPTDENVYQFLDQVFTEVASLFPYQYIHIGGDECYKGFWEKDPKVKAFMEKNNLKNAHELQSYFTARVSKIIRSKNKKAIGWDEIMEGGKNEDVAVMNRFGEKGALEQTNKKLNVILAPGGNGLYFDYAQSYSDMEPSSHGQFAPIWEAYEYEVGYKSIPPDQKKYILGVEACVWTESIPSVAKLQYMILPRMLALAEIGWTTLNRKNYAEFASKTLPVHLQRFDQMGLNYRVPTVFNYTDTLLIGREFTFELKSAVPGSKIYYTLNNRFPGDADHLYTAPFKLILPENKKYTLKTIVVTPSGKRSVLTRTVLYNPAIRKAIMAESVNPGLKYSLTTVAKIDSGISAGLNMPSLLKGIKDSSLKMEGYITISKDGYYEFSSNHTMMIAVDGAAVFDSGKPYPKFDKPDPLYLQKGLHRIKITNHQNTTGQTHLFLKEANGKEVELPDQNFLHE